MNSNLHNSRINDQHRRVFLKGAIAEAVGQMTTQNQADIWCRQADQSREAMETHVVFDPHVARRSMWLLFFGCVMLIAAAFGLVAIKPAFQDGVAMSLIDVGAAAGSVAALAAAASLLWRAWWTRARDAYPDITAEQVRLAHGLRSTIGEQHKQPALGWERPTVAFGHALECAGFAYLALLGLGSLPPYVALCVAVALGVVITGAVAQLGRLHAQRAVIVRGLQMYRSTEQLARELREAKDPQAGKYTEQADALRMALSPANLGQFEAPSRLRISVLWLLLGSLIGLALVLRIVFGAVMGAGAVVGAIMLAVATVLIFLANHRMAERFASVAGDSGQQAMHIAAAFPSVEAFETAVTQHHRQVQIFFNRVMLEAAQLHELGQTARDPLRPRLALKFASGPAPTQGTDAAKSPKEVAAVPDIVVAPPTTTSGRPRRFNGVDYFGVGPIGGTPTMTWRSTMEKHHEIP